MWVQFITKPKKRTELKAYILLFFCSVTRAVHIDLEPNLTTAKFINGFKRLISRRDKHQILYSDNANFLKTGTKWLPDKNKDQKLQDFLSWATIVWKYNVPKAPYWNCQFERLIGLVKISLYRTVRKVQLIWADLEEFLLNIEIIFSNRLLTFIEEEIDHPFLTPNSFILGGDVNFCDECFWSIQLLYLLELQFKDITTTN